MRKTKKKPAKQKRRSPAAAIVALLAVALLGFFGWMGLQARITRLEPAKVYLKDLPAQLAGTRILYISDLKLHSDADAKSAAALMNRLAQLEPDILLLGGDYTGSGLMDSLNGAQSGSLPGYAAGFVASLADFPAPMGKFAVAGDMDGDLKGLERAFTASGVQCLFDSSVELRKNGARLHIAGLSDWSLSRGGGTALAKRFSGGECVIALAHNPASYADIRVAEVPGGGAWADLVLSGHTLGGQISLFGRTLRSFSDLERRTLAGWFYPNDLPLLVSQGLGCDGAMLRLNSRSEVHLIELYKQEIVSRET